MSNNHLKKWIKYMVLILVLSFFSAQGQEVTAMTYNIRLDLASDGPNAWPHRKDFLSQQILFLEPDLLGVQEALPHQVDDLRVKLVDYGFIGQGRDGKNQGEYSGIFYNKNKVSVDQPHTFWLSSTPDKVSKGWDAALNRICTYGLFTLRTTGQKIWVFNTHLDHVGVEAQSRGLDLIINKIKSINVEGHPVILMGDFNLEEDSEPLKKSFKILADSRKKAQLVFGPFATFNEFNYDVIPTRRLDYILVSSTIEVKKYGVLTSVIEKRYPSDHFPVYVQLIIPTGSQP